VESLKNWNPGKADEVWKVMICARDAQRVDDIITCLCYILTDAGSNKERGIDLIARMNGKQIIDGLIAYKDSAYKSVRSALTETPSS
jgi:hypothetical protein